MIEIPAAIRLNHVSRWFSTPSRGRYTAIENIHLDVREGQFLAVVGPSGCGKSTLLNVAAGLLAPSQGSVEVFNQQLSGLNRRAGYMFQQDSLLPWKTVLGNVMLGLEFRHKPRKEAEELARDWLSRVGIADFADSFPHQLSGGMRKRASMVQSWIVDPDILLM